MHLVGVYTQYNMIHGTQNVKCVKYMVIIANYAIPG